MASRRHGNCCNDTDRWAKHVCSRDTSIIEAVNDLAKTILRVLENRATWPSQIAAGRKFVEQERSWKNSVARYVPVYEKLGTGHALSGLNPETTPA